VILTSAQAREEWSFKDGTLIINAYNSSGSITLSDTGAYILDTGLSKDYLKVSGFTGSRAFFNTTWQFFELSEKFLALANDRDNTSGLQLKEFVKLD
jgi:hypothetical protein